MRVRVSAGGGGRRVAGGGTGGVRIYIEMMTNIYRAAKGFVTHVEDNVALMIRHANRNVVRLRSLFSDTHRELRSFAWVT